MEDVNIARIADIVHVLKMIKKIQSEYVHDGVFYSVKEVRIFGILVFKAIFSTTNTEVISPFIQSSKEDDEDQNGYKPPVVVNGFIGDQQKE